MISVWLVSTSPFSQYFNLPLVLASYALRMKRVLYYCAGLNIDSRICSRLEKNLIECKWPCTYFFSVEGAVFPGMSKREANRHEGCVVCESQSGSMQKKSPIRYPDVLRRHTLKDAAESRGCG